MNPFRRRPLALWLACALAPFSAAQALALPPLTVDPALLGLPTLPPAEPKAAAPLSPLPPSPSPSAAAAAVEETPAPRSIQPAEVQPAAQPIAPAVSRPPAVEVRPVQDTSALERPAPTMRPMPAKAVVQSSVQTAPVLPPPAAAPVVQRAASLALRPLPLLQVDPALLGQPALAKVPGVASPLSSAGNVVSGGLSLRSAPMLVPMLKKSDDSRPVFVTANRIIGQNEVQTVAEGEVELRKIGTVLTADKLTYWPADDETEAVGHVVLTQDRGVVSGPKLRLNIGDQVGYFETPSYIFRQEKLLQDSSFNDGRFNELRPVKGAVRTAIGRGEAERIDFEGEDKVALKNATYSTCKPGNNAWYAKVDHLKLDFERQEAEGDNGTIYFKEVLAPTQQGLRKKADNQKPKLQPAEIHPAQSPTESMQA